MAASTRVALALESSHVWPHELAPVDDLAPRAVPEWLGSRSPGVLPKLTAVAPTSRRCARSAA